MIEVDFWATCPACKLTAHHHCVYQPRNIDARQTEEILVPEFTMPVVVRTSGPTLYDRQCVACGHSWST